MTFRENIREFWFDMTILQCVAVTGVFLAVTVMLLGSAWSYISTSIEIRQLEREATIAKRDAEAALEAAVKIAEEKKLAELKLAESEAKRNAKQPELDKASRDAADAVAEYERAIRIRRTDNPSTEQLCAELSALGYPCS